MSTPPPEASTEYSRGPDGPGGGSTGSLTHPGRGTTRRLPGLLGLAHGVPAALLATSLLGVVLLVVAEFATLFSVRTATSSLPIKSVTTGPHHAYALIPIGVLTVGLAFGAFRYGSRPTMVAIGALGMITLLIALLGDLPDARATGLTGSSTVAYIEARSTPSAGFFLEALGAVLLVITSGLGLVLISPPAPGGRAAVGLHADTGLGSQRNPSREEARL
jgi:hypothetical protein